MCSLHIFSFFEKRVAGILSFKKGNIILKTIRLILVGFGVVGQGFAEIVSLKKDVLAKEADLELRIVGVATGRDGFIYHEQGLEPETLLQVRREGQSLQTYPGARHWSRFEDAVAEIEADALVEVSSTNLRDAEPALSYIKSALSKGWHVVTANKGPGALAPFALYDLASAKGVQLRMEASVMAGTPVLSTILEGLAGSRVQRVRGVINGTTNYILTAMAAGRTYADVLAEAQRLGYAETDPTADVEGYDALAKVLILSALVFKVELKPEDVTLQGITGITLEQVEQANQAGQRIKLVASIERTADGVQASVKPQALALSDPLARVDGSMNALSIETDTLSPVTVIGPGAGKLETAQGLLADLLAIFL